MNLMNIFKVSFLYYNTGSDMSTDLTQHIYRICHVFFQIIFSFSLYGHVICAILMKKEELLWKPLKEL